MRGPVREEIHFLSVEFYLILFLEIQVSGRNDSKPRIYFGTDYPMSLPIRLVEKTDMNTTKGYLLGKIKIPPEEKK